MNKPINNLAVVFRGHLRTWYYTKDTIFAFFDQLAHNVDYYITTWDLPGIDIEQLETSFKNKNLKKISLINPNCQYFQAHGLYNGWLTQHINSDIDVNYYDFVAETRPDVICDFNLKHTIFDLQTDTIYTSYIDKSETGQDRLSDIFFLYSSKLYEKFSKRFKFNDTTGDIHITLGLYIKHLQLKYADLPWVFSEIIRPSSLENKVDIPNFFKPSPLDFSTMNNEWSSYPNEKKIEVCNRFNIYLDDYKTSGSNLLKIY